METFTFSHTDFNGVMMSVSFVLPTKSGVHMSTFHDMCKRMAAAAGYAEKSIESYFGETALEAYDECEVDE